MHCLEMDKNRCFHEQIRATMLKNVATAEADTRHGANGQYLCTDGFSARDERGNVLVRNLGRDRLSLTKVEMPPDFLHWS